MATRVRGAGSRAPGSSVWDGRDKRIDDMGAAGLIALALFFDLMQMAQLIPLVGFLFMPFSPIITIVAYTAILFSVKVFFKVPILGGKQVMVRFGAIFASMVIEFIPLLGAIPAITPGVIALIVSTRLEDAGKGRILPRAGDLLTKKRRAAYNQRAGERLQQEESLMRRDLSDQKGKTRFERLRQVRAAARNETTAYRNARAFDVERVEEGSETPAELQTGDRVRLTHDKERELRKAGLMDRYPSIEGTVMNITSQGYAVQFGTTMSWMRPTDIERA